MNLAIYQEIVKLKSSELKMSSVVTMRNMVPPKPDLKIVTALTLRNVVLFARVTNKPFLVAMGSPKESKSFRGFADAVVRDIIGQVSAGPRGTYKAISCCQEVALGP